MGKRMDNTGKILFKNNSLSRIDRLPGEGDGKSEQAGPRAGAGVGDAQAATNL